MAATVATATPCCPAPVSAMTRSLFHTASEQGLAYRVINFMCSGMTQIFSLKINFGATECFGEAFGKIEGSGAPNKVLEAGLKFVLKLFVLFDFLIGLVKLMNRRHQGFGHIHAPEFPEAPMFVRIRCH